MYHPQSVNQQEPVTRQPVANNRVAPNTQTRQPRQHGGGDQQIVLEEWNFGLFSCFSFKKGAKLSTCCWTTFCPCVTEWRIALRLGESCLYPTVNYSPMATCNPCGPICGCVQGYLAMSTRFSTLVGIKDSQMKEGCLWVFCTRCMLCRMLNEMELRGVDWEK